MTSEKVEDNRVERVVEKRMLNSSCIAINYDVFRELYEIDLQRETPCDEPLEPELNNVELPEPVLGTIEQADLPF